MLRTLSYIVYIVKSLKDGSFYIGQTSDLKRRINDHNNGKSKYTSSKTPWELVYLELFDTRSEAFLRESFLKKQKKRSYIERLIKDSRAGSSAG